MSATQPSLAKSLNFLLQEKKFLADYLAKDPAAYPADHPRLKM